MKKSLLVITLLLLNNLSAATLTTDQETYLTTQTIKVTFKGMDNHHKDWIGLYPIDTDMHWKNLLKWAWTQDKSEGTLTFKNLPAGDYELRAFYNNSYDLEAKKVFKVKGKNKLEIAKEHCIDKDDSTANILCSPMVNKVYILEEENHESVIYSIDTNPLAILNKERIVYKGYKNSLALHKLEDTELFYVESATSRTHFFDFYFFMRNRLKLSIPNISISTDTFKLDSIKTTNHGKKLLINFHHRTSGDKTSIAYDISDVSHPALIPDEPKNKFIETFYTNNHRYSFNYRKYSYPPEQQRNSTIEWVILDKNGKKTDSKIMHLPYNEHAEIRRVKGADVFIVNTNMSLIDNWQYINNEGKLKKLNLTEPASNGGRIEGGTGKVYYKIRNLLLDTKFKVYKEHKEYYYTHDITDLSHPKLISKRIVPFK